MAIHANDVNHTEMSASLSGCIMSVKPQPILGLRKNRNGFTVGNTGWIWNVLSQYAQQPLVICPHHFYTAVVEHV